MNDDLGVMMKCRTGFRQIFVWRGRLLKKRNDIRLIFYVLMIAGKLKKQDVWSVVIIIIFNKSWREKNAQIHLCGDFVWSSSTATVSRFEHEDFFILVKKVYRMVFSFNMFIHCKIKESFPPDHICCHSSFICDELFCESWSMRPPFRDLMNKSVL